METQFGLAHVWNQGDWVTRTVALILLGMSVASWVVIIVKALDLRRHLAQARRSPEFWHSQDFAAALGKRQEAVFRVNPDIGAGGRHGICRLQMRRPRRVQPAGVFLYLMLQGRQLMLPAGWRFSGWLPCA